MSATWGYSKEKGPHTWADNFPAARGIRQSPIDISTSKCVNTTQQEPLRLSYTSCRLKAIVNTGYGFRVDVDSEGFDLVGGPLPEKYRMEQFHFHWGRNDSCGSEHTVDGVSFPAEVHLVHWNAEKYGSFAEAASKADGLAVLGTFLQLGAEHEELTKLTDMLSNIRFKDDKIEFQGDFDLISLLPENKTYWTYPGSLTTPPCNESVTWIVFKEPIQMSSQQLSVFRDLCSYCQCDECPDDEFGGQIQENFRPPLPVGERVVRECTF